MNGITFRAVLFFNESLFQRPKNINQALKRRLKLTWKDIANHWFIFESFRQLKPVPDEEMIQIEDIMDVSVDSLCEK